MSEWTRTWADQYRVAGRVPVTGRQACLPVLPDTGRKCKVYRPVILNCLFFPLTTETCQRLVKLFWQPLVQAADLPLHHYLGHQQPLREAQVLERRPQAALLVVLFPQPLVQAAGLSLKLATFIWYRVAWPWFGQAWCGFNAEKRSTMGSWWSNIFLQNMSDILSILLFVP